jgi:asparagine synthase (glutamine-hydrolysing)
MCGIVGALVFQDSPFTIDSKYIAVMRDAMVHRGPDGAGAWISNDGRVGLGHRRLSIIDLSPNAAQPMCNEDGTIWVVFNGEIYNHAEIRAELGRIGKHRWKTDHSDTEVIIHAFEEWGIDCVSRFRGMFSIALWDENVRMLWLIRDRIGIKPLYYSFHDDRITFASEIKALLQDPDQKRAVDEESLFHYLSFLTAPAPRTLFDGINKLSGGTWLCIREDGNVREERYWDVLDHTKPLVDASEDDIASQLIEKLRASIRLHKVSDVPVGIFLSGGIDSSTNAALFSEGERERVRTFTIGYHGEYRTYRNELHYARKMADKVKAEYRELLLTIDDLIDFLPHMVYLQDEPIADPVCVPVYYISRLAREDGVIVCQVGEGADELFCGYPGWKTALQLERLNELPVPNLLKKVGLFCMRLSEREQSFQYEWLQRGASGIPVFWGGAEAFTGTQKMRLLSPRLRKQFRLFTSWEVLKPIRKRFEKKAWEKSHLHWMTYLDLNVRLPELLLMRVDKMSMGVSLEGRVPFLDHEFVEFAMSIPSSVKTKRGILKYILKKAVRGLIPDQIIDRPKQGFGVPIYEWFFDKLGQKSRQAIEELCAGTDYLDRSEVLRYFDEGRGPLVWYLLNFALWWKRFIG